MALPNLHPAIVHFPVALLIIALGFDASCLLLRRYVWLDSAAAALYLLGALGAGGAYVTGRLAEDGLSGVPAQVQPLIAEHADWALRTLLFFAVLAVARLVLAWRDRRANSIRLTAARLIVLVLAVPGPWLLFQTADRGGRLVYRHGLAVAVAQPAATSPPPAPPPASAPAPVAATSQIERASDGSLRWHPVPGDREAIGRDLTFATGCPTDAVRVAASTTGGDGIEFSVSRQALLLLPGSFGDVEVAAEFDIGSFQGAVGLAHHVKSANEAEVFVLSSSGEAALKRLAGAAPVGRDSDWISVPAGLLRLSVSSVGTHFKGAVAGRTVVHGHGTPTDGSAVGLFFDGVGTVGVRQIQVTPLRGR